MSKYRIAAAVAFLLASLVVASVPAADIKLGAGAKFAWDNYKQAVLDYSSVQGGTQNSAGGTFRSTDYPSPRFGGNLQLNINRRIVVLLNLDFGAFKHTVYPYPEGADVQDTQQSTHKFVKFGIGAEGKFYLTPPKDGRAAPYVFGGLGKYFAKTKTPFSEGELASSKTMSKLASPFYFQLGFGAEYILNESFSFGADLFGFRLETAKASPGEGADYDSTLGNDFFTGDQTYVNFYLYTALTINFTFLREKADAPAQSEGAWVAPAQQQNAGWGTDANAGWGTPAPAPANNWGTPAAPASNNWGTADASAQAAPPPAQPAAPPAKKKKKVAVSGSVGGGASAAPPPPAP